MDLLVSIRRVGETGARRPRGVAFLIVRAPVLAGALTIGACAGSPVHQAVVDSAFPTKTELAALAAAPLPSRLPGIRKGHRVDSWELAGPFPPAAGSVAYTGDDEFTRAAAAQLERPGGMVTLTESMQCYAHEMGRFLAEHGDLPQDDLQSFAMGRCGVVPNTPTVVYSRWGEPPPPDKAAGFVDRSTKRIRGPYELGVWKGSGAKGHIVVAAFGAPQVKLGSAAVTRAADPLLRVQGRVLESTASVRAYTTAGELGYRRCASTPGSAAVLPDFDLQCPLASDDPYAVFDMVAAAPNAVLSRQVLTLVVPVRGEMPSSYTSLAVGVVPRSEAGILEQVNGLRAKRGLGPLREVPQQSQWTAGLLQPYYATPIDEDPSRRESIILGLLAGWDVRGPLRDSQFLSFLGRAGDVQGTLAELLFYPSNRSVLLDPQATQVAVATGRDAGTDTVFGLLTTYATFDPRSNPVLEASILDELDRQREARGKKPVVRAGGPEASRVFDHTMAKLSQGESTPTDGLEQAVRTLRRRFHRRFQGQVFTTRGIEGWRPQYSRALLDTDDIQVTAKVGYFAAQGSNWGQYVTYLVFLPTFTAEEPADISGQVFAW